MKRKLLMVDDDDDLLESFGRVLALEQEWEFHGAHDAKEAVRRIHEVSPDVLILDIDLGPGQRTGLDLLRDLRAHAPFRALPVVLFTGVMLDTAQRAAGLDLGADDYVLKPVSPPVLLAKAKAAIRRAQGG